MDGVAALNFANRPNPTFSEASFISWESAQRVANIAIPFLCFNSSLGKVVNIGSSIGNLVTEIPSIQNDLHSGEWTSCAKRSVYVAYTVALAAASILLPAVSFVISSAFKTASDVHQIGWSLWNGDLWSAANASFDCVVTLSGAALCVFSGPEWVLLSLLLQAAKEFKSSVKEFLHGRYPEGIANFVLGALRVNAAKDPFFTVKRNWFGRKVTQEIWDDIVSESTPDFYDEDDYFDDDDFFYDERRSCQEGLDNRVIDVSKELESRNLSSYISGIEINSEPEDPFYGFSNKRAFAVKGVHFSDCDFERFSGVDFMSDHSSFTRCNFKVATFANSTFSNSQFIASDLTRTNFYNSRIIHTIFSRCNLTSSIFLKSRIDLSVFHASKLTSANFFNADVFLSLLVQNDLTDNLLTSSKDEFFFALNSEGKKTKPVIAQLADFRSCKYGSSPSFYEDVSQSLEENGANLMLVDKRYGDFSSRKLGKEVHKASEKVDYEDSTTSVTRQILDNVSKNSQVQKVVNYANEISKYVDGVVFDGGADVEEVFYTKTPQYGYFVSNSVSTRTVLEMSLGRKIIDDNKAIMGICRGSQLVNVLEGGSLKDVSVQSGISQFEYTSKVAKERFAPVIGEDVIGLSMHSQAIDRLAPGLEVILEGDGVAKFTVNDSGSTVLTQFHPEFYTFSNNRESTEDFYDHWRWELGYFGDDDFNDEYNKIVEQRRLISKNREFYNYFVNKAKDLQEDEKKLALNR